MYWNTLLVIGLFVLWAVTKGSTGYGVRTPGAAAVRLRMSVATCGRTTIRDMLVGSTNVPVESGRA